MDLGGPFERSRAVAPRHKNTSAIIAHRGFEAWTGSRHQVSHPTSQAKPHDTHSPRINEPLAVEKVQRGVDIANDRTIAQPATARWSVVFAIRTIAVIEVRRHAEVSGAANPLGHLFHELIDSVLVLDEHHCGK